MFYITYDYETRPCSKKQKFIIQVVKVARKQSREEEIRTFGKPLNYNKIIPSKNFITGKGIRKKTKLIDRKEIRVYIQ